jgi:predicted nucleic acid-binding protein
LGLDVSKATMELTRAKKMFTFFPDTVSIYPVWETLVTQYAVHGKNTHDARLVAAMLVHGITHLLTFNTGDFTRYTGVTVLDPAIVAVSATPPPP